ncbi:hypothetical protein HK099_008109 [Clydaea vesicula]|uniref:Uncharacterized protein n=1 Tax=Clydaea vesicula TaxID=447962 RepID=A0AAD5TXS3_9FUNG|nr:hypothetical protein HK099_008109 [Clydaea vesicula]
MQIKIPVSMADTLGSRRDSASVTLANLNTEVVTKINLFIVNEKVNTNSNIEDSVSDGVDIEADNDSTEVPINNLPENTEEDNSITNQGIIYESEEFKQVGIFKRLNLGINELYHFLIDVEKNTILQFTSLKRFKAFIYKRATLINEQRKKAEIYREVLATLSENVHLNTIGGINNSGLQLLLPSENGNFEIAVGVNNYDLVKPIAGLLVYDGFQCMLCSDISNDTHLKPFYARSVKMMKKHLILVHGTTKLPYSLCKVQKAFSNNKTPYKYINNRFFGVKVEIVQDCGDDEITEYSENELLEILERVIPC